MEGLFSSDVSIVRCSLCFSVKFCSAWLKLLRAHFLQQTSDERFRTRQACRSVSSPGLSCAVRLSKAPGDPACSKGRAPLASRNCCKRWQRNSLAIHLWGFLCVCVCVYQHHCRIYGPADLCRQTDLDTDAHTHKCNLHFLQYLHGQNQSFFI